MLDRYTKGLPLTGNSQQPQYGQSVRSPFTGDKAEVAHKMELSRQYLKELKEKLKNEVKEKMDEAEKKGIELDKAKKSEQDEIRNMLEERRQSGKTTSKG